MEDHVWKRAAKLAFVVRDFAPSRLERQLLAQAFELAWNRSHALEAKGGAGLSRANDRLDWVSTDSHVVTSQAMRG
jgi:hypothetical protein